MLILQSETNKVDGLPEASLKKYKENTHIAKSLALAEKVNCK